MTVETRVASIPARAAYMRVVTSRLVPSAASANSAGWRPSRSPSPPGRRRRTGDRALVTRRQRGAGPCANRQGGGENAGGEKLIAEAASTLSIREVDADGVTLHVILALELESRQHEGVIAGCPEMALDVLLVCRAETNAHRLALAEQVADLLLGIG